MRELFIQYAGIACSNESMLSVFQELRKICAQNALYHEEGACLEKIWHITHEHKLYEEVGDIFLYKVRNSQIANAAYNKYLYHTNQKFYNKYANNLKALGYDCADTENSDEDLPDVIVSLCDRFDAIVYMMICLHKNNDFEGVLTLVKYLSEVKNKIITYKNLNKNQNSTYWDDIICTEKHLSEVLSNTQNRNDINQLAITLNSNNKKAYFNILKDLITYNKYKEAIDFYNNSLCKIFNCNQTGNIKTLCWIISDFYKDIYEFYNAVFMQKIALELELREGNINA